MFLYDRRFIFVFNIITNLLLIVFILCEKKKDPFGIVFSLALILIGLAVYMLIPTRKTSIIFSYLMTSVSWVLVAANMPNNVFLRYIGRTSACIAPVLLLIFFAHLMNLENSKLYKKSLITLWIVAGVAVISHSTNIYILNYTLFPVIILAILFCILLSRRQKNKQRSFFRRYQAALIIAILVSLVPFVLINTIFRRMLPESLIFLTGASVYTSIVLPLVVGYILVKRDEIKTYTLTSVFKKKFILVLILIAIFITITLNFYKIDLIELGLIIFTATLMIYTYAFFNFYFSKQQIDLLSETKKNYAKEKLEIIQELSYDEFLSAMKNFFTTILSRTVDVDGILIIWNENDHIYILTQTGIFKDYSLDYEEIFDHMENISLEGKEHLLLPLSHDTVTYGYIILGDKKDHSNFTNSEVQGLQEIAKHIAHMLYTSEKAYNTQQQYIRLPSIEYDDYINYQYLAQIESLRKELSLYLHDEVLQTVLALRNMTGALDTSSKDIADLMLSSFDALNASIREKMFDIYPSTLEVLDLSQSISIMCDKMKENIPPQSPMKITKEIDPKINVSNNLKYPIFRMTKELLQNAIKHSEASEVTVSLQQEGNILYLHIFDDGIGFDVSEKLEGNFYSHHIGLLSIKQDINSLHGELSVRSIPGEGTDILIKLPTEEKERKK